MEVPLTNSRKTVIIQVILRLVRKVFQQAVKDISLLIS